MTFSRRHDCRTIFASNVDYGSGRRAGAWTGSDRTAIAACRRVLRNAKIPPSEIAGVEVQNEMGRTAERLSEAEFRIGEATLLRKLARARRTIRGIPIWSSYAMVGLTAKGDVGSLEVHWPDVSETVVKEAGGLQQLIKRGFKPPAVEGGRPESVEAGVVHSAARSLDS